MENAFAKAKEAEDALAKAIATEEALLESQNSESGAKADVEEARRLLLEV